MDCPDVSYLAALASAAPRLDELADDAQHERVKVMVHMAAEGVACTHAYRAFIELLPRWQHVFVGRAYDAETHGSSLPSSYRVQVCLTLCDLDLASVNLQSA